MKKISSTFRELNPNSDGILPPLTKDLIEELDKLFPDKAPDIALSEKEIYFKSGQVSVVRFLKDQFLRQNDLTEF
jgi:hypothetical protein